MYGTGSYTWADGLIYEVSEFRLFMHITVSSNIFFMNFARRTFKCTLSFCFREISHEIESLVKEFTNGQMEGIAITLYPL